MDVERYINDRGEVGVLVSPGFGAGWSSWGRSLSEFLSMDRGLVKLALEGASGEQASAYIVAAGHEVPYMGGWGDVEVEFIPKGSIFRIDEYDGSESLILQGDDDLLKA